MRAFTILALLGCLLVASNANADLLPIQTIFGSGFKGAADGIGTEGQIYNLVSMTPVGRGFVLLDDNQDDRAPIVRTFSVEDNALKTGTNAPFPALSVFAPSLLINDAIWLYTPTSLLKLSINPAYRSIIYFTTAGRGYLDTNINRARFSAITGLGKVTESKFLILDGGNRRFRLVDFQNDKVTTFAGTGANSMTDGPVGVGSVSSAFLLAPGPDGSFYFIDGQTISTGQYLRQIAQNGSIKTITRFYHNGVYGNRDGTLEEAVYGMRQIEWIAGHPDGSLIFIDSGNIRRISGDRVSTLAAEPLADFATQTYPKKLTVSPDGSIFYEIGNRVRKIAAQAEKPGPALAGVSAVAVSIEGTPLRNYRIEGADSPDAGEWKEIEQITLLKSPQVWFDQSPPANRKRFYRAVLLP